MGGALLDLRDEEAFDAGHVAGATSIPLEELRWRMFELPPPYEEAVSLCGTREHIAAAEEILGQYGWVIESTLDVDTHAWPPVLPLVQGTASRPIWKPSSFLQEVLGMEEVREWAASRALEGGKALGVDVGCGAGRDVCLLARELGPRWDVLGLDNHKGALERMAALAAREGVVVKADSTNLRKERGVELMGALRADLIHGSRFMHRPLLALAQEGPLLKPGGLLVWSTFLQGSEQVRNGRSLERGELREGCERAGFRVLRDEEGTMVTSGKTVAAGFFAAFKNPA